MMRTVTRIPLTREASRVVWLLAMALIATAVLAQPVPSAAQDSSGSGSGSTSQSQSSDKGSNPADENIGAQAGGQDGGSDSFFASILPDFVKGWFGMDQNSDGSGGPQGRGGQTTGTGGPDEGSQQAPAVVAAMAEVQSVGERYEFIGRIEAIQKVTVQTRVAGFIQAVFFKGGDRIKAGDKLFQIEPDQYQASLQAAQAQLASAKATESQAQRSLQRNQELAKNGTVSQAQLDDARATYEQAQGSRLQAEAQVRQAQLALDYTTIVAPIDGQISEPLITKGNYVTVTSGALANLIQENPIWGTFPIGENRLSTWRKVGIDGKTRNDDAGNAAAFDLSLILPNEQEYGQNGAFSFVSNTVDPQTGTVMVRVEFPNENGILLPDENVTMVASQKNPPRQPVVPQAAVQLSREGRSVFVVNDDDTVHHQPITVGKTLSGEVAVTKGLKGGEYVVVQGQQNVKDGDKVRPTFQNGDGRAPGNSSQAGERTGGVGSDGGGQNGGQPKPGSKEGADSAFGTSTGRSQTPPPDAESNGGGEGNSSPSPDSTSGQGSDQAPGADNSGGKTRIDKQPHQQLDNAADQRIGTQGESETRAAGQAGPSNKQTPVEPQPQSQPRSKSENTGGKPSSGGSPAKSGNGA